MHSASSPSSNTVGDNQWPGDIAAWREAGGATYLLDDGRETSPRWTATSKHQALACRLQLGPLELREPNKRKVLRYPKPAKSRSWVLRSAHTLCEDRPKKGRSSSVQRSGSRSSKPRPICGHPGHEDKRDMPHWHARPAGPQSTSAICDPGFVPRSASLGSRREADCAAMRTSRLAIDGLGHHERRHCANRQVVPWRPRLAGARDRAKQRIVELLRPGDVVTPSLYG